MAKGVALRIVVYDIAADSGGALSVLMEYYNKALMDNDNEYLFIIGVAELEEACNVKVLRVPATKRSWFHRVVYDALSAHRVIHEFGADKVVSLQNTTVPFCDARQIVYMHNLLPRQICDEKFRLLRDPKLWVYQNIIGSLIVRSCKNADGVIVQARWIKDRLVKRCGISSDVITVERPSTEPTVTAYAQKKRDDVVRFFYPASGEPFKNHEVIVKACELLNEQSVTDYQVIFTLSGNESKRIRTLKGKVQNEGLPIVFAGWLTYEEVSKAYSESACLLFPSKIETFGLPLLEAKAFGISIIAANLEYAHEAIGSYPDAAFFNPGDYDGLRELMSRKVFEYL